MKHTDPDNIIHFTKFKSMYDENAANKCFKEYLQVLTFSELISESNQVISDLRNGKMDKDLTVKSRLILKEFEKRTGANNKLSKIREDAEDKIINLEDHL